MRRIFSIPLACVLFASASAAAPFPASTYPGQEQLSHRNLERPDQADSADLLLTICLAHFALGDVAAAQRSCSQVLLSDPKQTEALKLRGYTFLFQRRFERAGADFRAGLRIRPADDQLLAGYGRSLAGMGRFEESVAQFRRALARSPDNAPYWNGLCWSQAGTGRKLDQALAACDKALRLEPGAAGARNGRALVFLRMGHFARAIADYRLSLKTRSDQATAYFGLGLARLQIGDRAGAADIQEARRLDLAVDQAFIDMHILPETCGTAGKIVCPRGFPARLPARRENYPIVKSPVRQPGLRVADLLR